MMQITQNARRQHERREDAERAIEVFYPAGYLYQVEPVVFRLEAVPVTFAVKVYHADGPFLGFAWDPEEEGEL